jgi:hypothetical protein
MTRETDPTRALFVPSTAFGRYDNLYRKSGHVTAQRIKLTEVLYVSWIWQWCSILCSQADASRVADLSHSEGTLQAGGELVHSLMGKNALEHQNAHLELPATHKPLVIAPDGTMHF